MTAAVGEHPRGSSPEARLARLGFTDTGRVAATLDVLGLALDTERGAVIVPALATGADPDLALATLSRVVEGAAPSEAHALLAALGALPGARRRIAAVLGASAALGEHLVRHPADWHLLADDLATADPPSATSVRARLLDAVGALPGAVEPHASGAGPDVLDALRLAYRRELLVLAARDLTGTVTLDAVMAELANLAGAALDAALAVARVALSPSLPPIRFAIVGMGKCGGRELNYVSDVDVLFVAEPAPVPAPGAGAGDPGASGGAGGSGSSNRAGAGDVGAQQAATRLAEGILRVCGAVTATGILFPVDANLRPEGRNGSLVRTLASYEAYYRRWASGWEYQALLKARPVAGDLALGQRFCDLVAPLVWSAANGDAFVSDVRAMRRRVEASLPGAEAGRELKLGPGGLRDVEFAVQLLSLVHGRTDPVLRQAATLPALAALSTGGYVGRADASDLAAAYRFLRQAEHRLQLQQLRRTHTVPRDVPALRWLGRSLGLAGADEFTAQHALTVRTVRRLHEKLFYRPLLVAVARLPDSDLRLSPAEAASRLEALGFRDTAGALRHIARLIAGVSRTAAIQRQLLPAMLGWFADAADPDAGLLAYRQLSEALGRTPWYLRLLRDTGGTAERLARLLSASALVAGLMERAPESVRMLRSEAELAPRPAGQLAMTLLAVTQRTGGEPAGGGGRGRRGGGGGRRAARRAGPGRAAGRAGPHRGRGRSGPARCDGRRARVVRRGGRDDPGLSHGRRAGRCRRPGRRPAPGPAGRDRGRSAGRPGDVLQQRRRRAVRPRAGRRGDGPGGGDRRRRAHRGAAATARAAVPRPAAGPRRGTAAGGTGRAAHPYLRVLRGLLPALVAALGSPGAAAGRLRRRGRRAGGPFPGPGRRRALSDVVDRRHGGRGDPSQAADGVRTHP
ncbi:MAG: bifunctional [glutamine synthetase] adenylyltransferase/[glutamine synthetase]-adenylyl-L-tyrosine phosphorylase [Frankia sp.]